MLRQLRAKVSVYFHERIFEHTSHDRLQATLTLVIQTVRSEIWISQQKRCLTGCGEVAVHARILGSHHTVAEAAGRGRILFVNIFKYFKIKQSCNLNRVNLLRWRCEDLKICCTEWKTQNHSEATARICSCSFRPTKLAKTRCKWSVESSLWLCVASLGTRSRRPSYFWRRRIN